MGLILCADDFALSPYVNAAICRLIEAGRLNAVSVMTGFPGVEAAARDLQIACEKAPGPVLVGLHFTLTQYKPLTSLSCLEEDGALPALGALMVKTVTGKVSAFEITAELKAQATRFQEAFGRKPDFLDGHQHVHTLPVIRKVVGAYAHDILGPSGLVRTCWAPFVDLPWGRPKDLARQALISVLARPSAQRLQKKRIKTNDRFYGVNGFDTDCDFRSLMRGWLKAANRTDDDVLIMCHPGLTEADLSSDVFDPIKARRGQEFDYLISDRFSADLAAFGLTLFE